MKQGASGSRVAHVVLASSQRRKYMTLLGLLALSVLVQGFNHSALAEPMVKVLFGSDECSFLPEQPTPAWLVKRPATSDYVGVSSASNPDRKLSSPEQMQAAEQNARAALAAEISVSVKETTTQFISERNEQSKAGFSYETQTQVDLLAIQVVDQTLEGSRIQERYLDRSNCLVHVMAVISKAAVEENKRKLIEKLRKLFRFKQLMLLDQTGIQSEMTSAIRGHLDALFKNGGNKLVAADSGHRFCADDPMQSVCQKPADIIYASYAVALDKEGATPEFKRRIYKLKGRVQFRDRLIASFDVACQGTGRVGQDHLIDQQAAKSCFDKAKPVIEKGMEGSE
jgi:hypothetical protein